MLHIYFSLSHHRVVPVSWMGSRTNKTSKFWFSALRPSVSMLTRSPLSGPSCPLFCSLETSASVHMRCVCRRDTLLNRTFVSYISWCCFRVSPLRCPESSVRLRPRGLAPCYRFPLKLCRPSSLTESQSVASHVLLMPLVASLFILLQRCSLISSLNDRRQPTTGSTALCL